MSDAYLVIWAAHGFWENIQTLEFDTQCFLLMCSVFTLSLTVSCDSALKHTHMSWKLPSCCLCVFLLHIIYSHIPVFVFFPPLKISVTSVNLSSSNNFLDIIPERLISTSLVCDPLKLLNYSETIELLKDKTVLTFFAPPVSNTVPNIFWGAQTKTFTERIHVIRITEGPFGDQLIWA